MTTKDARESPLVRLEAYQSDSNFHRVKGSTMKNKKYRSLMVTPAFIKARERKMRNENTYGRVLPAPKTIPSARGLSLSPVWASNEREETQLAKTSHSAPSLRSEKMNSTRRESSRNSRPRLGKHFLSWQIPDRVVSGSKIKEKNTSLGFRSKIPEEGQFTQRGLMPLLEREKVNKSLMVCKHSELPNIADEKRPPSKSSHGQEPQETSHDFAKEWLNKYNREDRQIAEELLRTPAGDWIAPNSLKQISLFSKRGQISNASSKTSHSTRPDISRLSQHTNILHRTQSVAWRRDSLWLKPTKVTKQSWHGLPSYGIKSDAPNIASMYMRPHRKLDSSYIIHPEWGCKA